MAPRAPLDDECLDLAAPSLQCHCGACKIEICVPCSSLPLSIGICHCTTCRHVTGGLAATVAPLPPSTKPSIKRGSVQPRSYRTSKEGLERFFCGHCGTSMYETRPDGAAFWDTGSLAEVTQLSAQFLKVEEHIFVADTKDGGLRDMMMSLPSWEGWQEQSAKIEEGILYRDKAAQASADRVPEEEVADDQDKLSCYCHCKGVSFHIKRPNKASQEAIMEEHLDLLVPWHRPSSERQNHDNEPFWLRGPGRNKYLAGLCVCSDCRTASGFEVQPWAFIPIANIVMPDRGTLVRYQSSERAWRDFCGTCGATVFFGRNREEGERECWDVSVGLMDAKSGARGEEWLEWWTERVSYEDRTVNQPFVEVLSRGVREWATMHDLG